MNSVTNCGKESGMTKVWAVIIGVILLMVVWGYVSTKLKARKRRKSREKSLPFVEDNFALAFCTTCASAMGADLSTFSLSGVRRRKTANFHSLVGKACLYSKGRMKSAFFSNCPQCAILRKFR